MKKCLKCNLAFQMEERNRCLYCNTLLMSDEVEDNNPGELDLFEEALGQDAVDKKRDLIAHIIKDRRIIGHGRMEYIVGSYFRTRTFAFMYRFSRNEFRMGAGYSRLLVQPVNVFRAFFVIPWVLYTLLDSLVVRLRYDSYCPDCGWKYHPTARQKEHDRKECDYCREYTLIVDEILTGRITQSEQAFKTRAFNKSLAGERSAYYDLCPHGNLPASVMDVVCVWFSVSVMLTVIVLSIWPLILKLLGLGFEMPELYLR